MKNTFKFSLSFLAIAVLAIFIGNNFVKASAPPGLTVSTSAATNVSKAAATVNGSVAYIDTPVTITERGFDYGTSTDYGSSVVADGDPVVGNFSASISGLSCGTTYHVRAYSIPVIVTYSKPRFLLAFLFNVAYANPGPQKTTGSDVPFTTSSCSSGTASSHRSYHGTSSVSGQVANLIAMGNPQLAQKIASEYGLSIPGTSSLVPIAQATTVVATSSPISIVVFERDLKVGSVGDDVKALQQYLNEKSFSIVANGPGSTGNETTYFGPATKAAVIQFQNSVGIMPASGYFGSLTREYIQSH